MVVQVKTPIDVSIIVTDQSGAPIFNDNVTATIRNKSTNQFFNGLFWVDDFCSIALPHLGDGKYGMIFIPETISIFEVSVISKQYNLVRNFNIESRESVDGDGPIKISSDTFLSQDGSDSKLRDNNGNPIKGVKIICYSVQTKTVASVAQSDQNGDWSMIINPGKYFFVFEKDGFISVSFEREVE